MTLSPTQLVIWKALIAGKRPKQITRRPMTTHEHCRRVRVKLGARTNVQAAVMLVRAGVL